MPLIHRRKTKDRCWMGQMKVEDHYFIQTGPEPDAGAE